MGEPRAISKQFVLINDQFNGLEIYDMYSNNGSSSKYACLFSTAKNYTCAPLGYINESFVSESDDVEDLYGLACIEVL